MNEVDQEFQNLMSRIHQGEQQAAWDLLELYGPHILRVVRSNLDQRLRSKFDSVDFVQSVWASFFREPSALQKLSSPKDLIGFLGGIARHKVWDEYRRRFETERHNMTGEQNLEDLKGGGDHAIETADRRQHRPSEIAVVREKWNEAMRNQTDIHQQVIELRFQGKTFTEIAEALNIDERTARRVVDHVVNIVRR